MKVKRVGMEHCKQAALSLARAFWNDPVAMYCIETPDDAWRTEKEKWELHVEIMEYIVAAHILSGTVHSIGDNFEGVALW